jgi:hypothetical protein
MLAMALPWPVEQYPRPVMRGRVTKDSIYSYQEPDFHSPRLDILQRDTLVDLYEQIEAPGGPAGNRRWYSLEQGYAHSAYLQRVEGAHLNPVQDFIPEDGQLGEITLPIAYSLRRWPNGSWEPLYRLYYDAVFWITSLVEGPDGRPWYGLTDDRIRAVYYVPAASMRPIPAEELTPISPQVPDKEKRLEVSLADQVVRAFESDRLVFEADISSGALLSGTPRGRYHIQVKRPSRHMGDGRLTTDLTAYELPGVPWVSYFTGNGVAFHGAYWHDNFGSPISHGCLNMRNAEAQWVYRWSTPAASPSDWQVDGYGTLLEIS